MKDKEYITDNHGEMKSIQKHIIMNACEFTPLTYDARGIDGIVPPEGLYMFGSGLYEILLDTNHTIVVIGNQNNIHKED